MASYIYVRVCICVHKSNSDIKNVLSLHTIVYTVSKWFKSTSSYSNCFYSERLYSSLCLKHNRVSGQLYQSVLCNFPTLTIRFSMSRNSLHLLSSFVYISTFWVQEHTNNARHTTNGEIVESFFAILKQCHTLSFRENLLESI